TVTMRPLRGLMRRREFIWRVAGLPALFPLAVAAQQGVRHVGILTNFLENDSEMVSRLAALRQGLAELGWKFGDNAGVDVRHGTDNEIGREKAKVAVVTPENTPCVPPWVVVGPAPIKGRALQTTA